MSEHLDQVTVSYDNLLDDGLQEGLERVQSYWAGKDLKDVVAEMPESTIVPIDNMRDVQLVELSPEGNDVNEQEYAVGLPYLNGYTPHHYIRAKTFQLLAAPNSRVWLMPNNSGSKKPAYTFTENEKTRLADGNFRPLGEVEVRAFNKIQTSRGLGALSVTGYSQGGLTALAMAASDMGNLHINRVNADEIPSVEGRGAKQLSKDFMKSGGFFALRGAIKDADIHALSQAMRLDRLSLDLGRFLKESKTPHGKLMNEAMKGTADELVYAANANGARVKLGFIEGSKLFDPSSISDNYPAVDIVKYVDGPFRRKHATGDNVKAHAIMAKNGLDL